MYDELSVGAFLINNRYINDLFITTYCKFRNAAKEGWFETLFNGL